MPRPLTTARILTRSQFRFPLLSNCSTALLATAIQTRAGISGHAFRTLVLTVAVPGMYLLRSGRDQVYSILWALVFGFATLNILSLGARRFEHARAGLNFGEILAIMVVLVSVVLLSWELLYMFHILPIHLAPR
jgi:hypothetical protein